MKLSSLRHPAALTLALLLAMPAQALLVTREFSGSWYDPAKVGQGFNLDIAGSGGSKTAVLYWYTYDAQGRPLWLYGQAPVAEGARLELPLYEVSGPRFAQDLQGSALDLRSWGRIVLDFDGCNSARASYAGTLGSGNLALVRLTGGYGATCTGTLVDDGAASTVASGTAGETVRLLVPGSAAPAASGKLKYRVAAGRVSFSFEAEDVPAGSYQLFGNGVARATLQVVAVPGGTRGEVEFDAPAESGSLPLDFDPRGMRFELRQNGTVFLSATLDVAASAGGGTAPAPAPPAGVPAFGSARYFLRFGAGSGNGASGHADLEQRSDRVDFSVEIEDVPAGSYELRIGGNTRGVVEVRAVPGGTVGETEFRYPVEAGKQLLDFDPRGQPLALLRNGATVLSTTFPAQPNAASSSAGNSGSNGSGGSSSSSSCGASGGSGDSVRTPLANVGPDSDACGYLEYETRSDRVEFKVEVQRLADGPYQLLVGGQQRAVLNAVGGRAEVEFRNPPESGHPALNFEFRGQLVQLRRDGVTYLQATAPGG